MAAVVLSVCIGAVIVLAAVARSVVTAILVTSSGKSWDCRENHKAGEKSCEFLFHYKFLLN